MALLLLSTSTIAQTKVKVPFVGCPSDGQAGPVEAPKGSDKSITASAREAAQLACYQGIGDRGVLAPRGWRCSGDYGSGGGQLYIGPDQAEVDAGRISGPGILVSYANGGGSGVIEVAPVVARVFPHFRRYAEAYAREFGQPLSYTPYPADKLTHRSDRLVEFTTPAGRQGLGTRIALIENGSPIEGAAMLVGTDLDLLTISVRLPAKQRGLAPIIIHQFESDRKQP